MVLSIESPRAAFSRTSAVAADAASEETWHDMGRPVPTSGEGGGEIFDAGEGGGSSEDGGSTEGGDKEARSPRDGDVGAFRMR